MRLFCLAFIQIAGAWFLLFRRTALLATVCFFAFMLNLLLINIFYGMNAGTLTQSVLVTISIILLLLEYRSPPVFFLPSISILPGFQLANQWAKNSIKLSALLLSLIYVLYTITY